MAEQTKEIISLFEGAKDVFNVPDIQGFVTEVKGFSSLARGLRENVERIRSELEAKVSLKSYGGAERTFSVPGQKSAAAQPDAKDRKTDQAASSANTAPSPTPGTTTPPSVSGDTGVNPVNSASAAATEPDANDTKAVPSETVRDSTASAADGADGWICASCNFRNPTSTDSCEKCATSRHALQKLKTELEEIKLKTGLVLPPSRWLPADPGTRAKRVKLAKDNEEYVKISDRMSHCCLVSSFFSLATLKRIFRLGASDALYDIKKIERIENLHLYQMYSIKKAQMAEENLSVVHNERRLWHGTSFDCIDNIASYGFNRSLCGKNGTAFGNGVYFCSAPCYSSLPVFAVPDKSGIQHMFLCRVLTGRYAAGESNMVEPPMQLNNLLRYNSLANCVSQPSIFVIFHDAQAYPEYLVTFKRLK